MIQTLLTVLFLASLLIGQFGSISIQPGITVYIHDIVLVLLLSATILVRPQKSFIRHPLFYPILGFIGIAALSLLMNAFRFPLPDVFEGSLYLLRWILYGTVIYIVTTTQKQRFLWEWGTYIAGVSFALLGFLQMLVLPGLRPLLALGWDEHYGRLFSTLFDPNFVGIVLVMIFFWGMHLFKEYKSKRLLIFFGQTCMGIAIVLTYSRSTYLAFFVGFVIWLIGSKQYIVSLFIFFLVGVFLIIPRDGRDVNRLDRMLSVTARLNNWKTSFELSTKAPVFGNGFNLLRAIAKKERSIDKNGVVSHDAAGVDNSLLFVLATTGSIGLVLYSFLLCKEAQVLKKSFGYTGISIGASLLTHSFFNNSLFYAWTMILFWIFLGLAGLPEKKIKKRM
jgi:hypothetical protein